MTIETGILEAGINWTKQFENNADSFSAVLETGFCFVDSSVVASGSGTFMVIVPSGYELQGNRFIVGDSGGNGSVQIVISGENAADTFDGTGTTYTIDTNRFNHFLYVGPNSSGGSTWLAQY